MGKKTLILSQQQLDEIFEGDSAYLDNIGMPAPDYANKITTDGGPIQHGELPKQTDTDDFGSERVNNWRGNAKLAGVGPVVVREMSVKEWKEKYLGESRTNEEKEHGNARLKVKNFGEKSYSAIKSAASRYSDAVEKSRSKDPQISAKGRATMEKMRANNPDIEANIGQYENAKFVDSGILDSKPEGQKIASSPKQSGNGKAHSPKNGVISYFE